MTGTNHTLVGTIIAVIVPAPLVPLVAFISHFVCDALPHFGQNRYIFIRPNGSYSRGFKLWLLLDALGCCTALIFAWWLFPDKWFIITVGATFAAGPDFLWLIEPYVKRGIGKRFFRFAHVIQWAELSWGWVLEIGYTLLFGTLLITLT